jgi:N4-gp56 family major capsid protein
VATGATEFIDNTTADNSIPELWSKKLIVARQDRLVFEKLVDTSYKDAMSFGDTIHVGSRGHLTTRSKSANTAITYETETPTNTDILINVDEYSAIAVENITDLQSMLNLIENYAPEMSYALAKAVDDVLAGLVDDFSTNVVGTLAVDLSYADLLQARQMLDDANVPHGSSLTISSTATTPRILAWARARRATRRISVTGCRTRCTRASTSRGPTLPDMTTPCSTRVRLRW